MGRKKHTRKKISSPPTSKGFHPPDPSRSEQHKAWLTWVLLGAVFLVAVYLAMVNLNWAAMWDDEAASAIFSKQLALNGAVSAWDGRNLAAFYRDGWFLDHDLIPRHPKMHYYINAAAYKLLGISAWSSRFIQALVGLAAAVVFILILRLDFRQRSDIQVIAFALLALSPAYLLAIRQSHYYAVSLFFNLLLFYCYRAHLASKNPVWFAAMAGAAIAAFYSQFLLGTAFALTLGLWHLLFFRRQYAWRDWIFASCAAGAFVIFVAAYFFITGYWSGSLVVTYNDPRLLRIAKLLLMNILAINENDFAPWPVWCWFVVGSLLLFLRNRTKKRTKKSSLPTHETDNVRRMIFLYGVFVILFIVIVSIGSTQPSSNTSWGDVRYLTSVLPFSAILCAGFVMAAHRLHLFAGAAVFIVMLSSNALAYPFLRHINYGGTPHFTLPALVGEVHSEYRTAYAEAATFLQQHATPDESVIAFPVFNNWPLLFYLGDTLRFCCHVSNASPIRQQTEALNPLARREKNFPDWLVFFSTAQIKPTLEYFSRSTVGGCRREYALVKNLQVFAYSTQRPEPVWHYYTPVTEFDPAASVYVFKVKPRTGDCG